TMKTQDTIGALDDLRQVVGSDVPVVCAQNGVENERLAARRFANVYSMLVQMPATFLTPGEVIVNASGVSGVLHAGRYPGSVDETITELCAGLEASEFASSPTAGILRLKYTKLLQNLGNAVQAVCGADSDADTTRQLGQALRTETLAVYEAAGIDFATAREFGEETGRLKRGDVEGFDRGGGSTWQSLARGAGSIETDYLNGEVILLGTLHGVPTPANRALQDCAVRALRDGLQPGAIAPLEVLEIARGYGWPG
ncbi:MAG: ketopantoate reductase C-terminal domain-containing protein, partial [Dehalococcoidia bacterium]